MKTRVGINGFGRWASNTKGDYRTTSPGTKGILEYSEEPLVSSDLRGAPHSAIIDGLSTMVIGGTMVKVIAWYDNEWGYSCRVANLAAFLANKGF